MFLDEELKADASIPQAACTGTSTGAQALTIQVTPISYLAKGETGRSFFVADASVPVEGYERTVSLQVAGGAATSVTNTWEFEKDSGVPMFAVLGSSTQTSYGDAPVRFSFDFVMWRQAPVVSPLPQLDDAGL